MCVDVCVCVWVRRVFAAKMGPTACRILYDYTYNVMVFVGVM